MYRKPFVIVSLRSQSRVGLEDSARGTGIEGTKIYADKGLYGCCYCIVSKRIDVSMGKLAYFGPLERPHGLQTWIVVQDPSIIASMVIF